MHEMTNVCSNASVFQRAAIKHVINIFTPRETSRRKKHEREEKGEGKRESNCRETFVSKPEREESLILRK